MRIGIRLHPERGIDAVFNEAVTADRQGFDSIWLADHLSNFTGEDTPDGPFEAFTLMTALGARTERVRLAWGMLNVSFRAPTVLAKMLTTLDHVSKGRVICALGSGWFKKEYVAYGIPLLDDHDDRAAFAREVVRLMKELWTHPAPERVNFKGRWLHTQDLAFNPAPYQRPRPPIWMGGESDATLQTVRELADGWVMLTSGTQARLKQLMSAPDWPSRPMTLVKNTRMLVAESRDAAIRQAMDLLAGDPKQSMKLDDFLAANVVGTAAECLATLAEWESWGINYLRVDCTDMDNQARVAREILPALT